jgi:hypothetical protein
VKRAAVGRGDCPRKRAIGRVVSFIIEVGRFVVAVDEPSTDSKAGGVFATTRTQPRCSLAVIRPTIILNSEHPMSVYRRPGVGFGRRPFPASEGFFLGRFIGLVGFV